MITLNHYRRVTLLALLGSWTLFAALYGIFQLCIHFVDQHPVSLMVSMLLSFLFIACTVGPAVTTVIATIRCVLNESRELWRYLLGGVLSVFFGIILFLVTLSLPSMTNLQPGDTLPQLWWRILTNGIPMAFLTGVALVVLMAEFIFAARGSTKG